MLKSEHYAPEEAFLWDSWFSINNKKRAYDVFHLTAPKTPDPEERHHNASIAHLRTKDLKTYTRLPDALKPGAKGAWDDLALWTGCFVRLSPPDSGRLVQALKLADQPTGIMYYTARKRDEFWVQKIGAALTYDEDFIKFDKYPGNPILEADPRFYPMTNDNNPLLGWRDPFIFKLPGSEKHLMTISANDKTVSPPYNACIALAEEKDHLLDWEIQPPIISPGLFTEMETTQVIHHNGLVYVTFSTWAKGCEPSWREQNSGDHEGGLLGYVAENIRGPFRPLNGNGIVLNNGREMYSVRIVRQERGNEFTAMGWLNKDEQGNFVGALSDPFTMVFDGDRVYKK